MKVIEAIREADNLKPNMFDVEDKIKWLSRLDMRITLELFDKHQSDTEALTFTGYGPDDQEKELLVGEPYAEMYVHWLEAQIDYNNMEYDAFNASNAMFESVFQAFCNAYHSGHMPKGTVKKYF